MSFPRYPKYKPSGEEWLGEVPEHWAVKRLRYLVRLNPSKTEISTIDRQINVSFLPMDAIGSDGSIDLSREKPLGELETGYTYLRNGDVAFAKITPCYENGKGAIMRNLSNGIGFGTTELIVARPIPTEIASSFLHYLFLTPQFRKIGEAHMYGAGGQKRVPDDFVRNFAGGFPSLEEQQAIASFLDHETAKIDALIAEQQRLIELLKEKRQAVISHAVTKGLNPHVRMKDSGVEWLGEVPEHWEVRRIGTFFRETNISGSDELPILSVSIHDGVSDKEFSDEEMDRKVTRSDDRSKYKKVDPGDLVYNMMRAWQGGFGAVEVCGMVSPAYVVAKPNIPGIAKFIEKLLRTPQAVEQMRRHSRGITDFRLRLYWDEFKNIKVVLPPDKEITEIFSSISEIESRFQKLSDTCDITINLLQERRTALISAAVTGQIDVRGFQPVAA